MLYTVYILYSPSHDKIYIGYTSNLVERMKSHNSLGTKGFTLKYRPWTVVYCQYYEDKSLAIQNEKKLKGAKYRTEIRSKILLEFATLGSIRL